ncbi:DUF5667 domain-containing protein [Bacillus sp. B-jedd]|uniref:DUF5667 domain-containing protein n=1 Tax=Bacillus sp. B-jedd TaxID=1476857 RepID=UPI0005155A6E|nr:DUF5667 domain-containing protein [Bacillus sp. B-jedd]CEG26588.1 hypothetical protein BN1002_01437 [Bacillus sp. B-jedd]
MKEIEMKKKIGKTALAMVLAGTFAFSPVMASANTLSGQDDKEAEKIITTEDAENVQVNDDAEKPALVPGDFFYFVKIALEKIRLAITFDHDMEAELLAGYAAERLAEAEELFNAGEEDRAVETIKSAIAYLNDYDKKAEDEESKEEPAVGEESGQPSDEEKPADEVQKDDEVADEQQPADEEAVVKDDEDATDSEQVVRQNIIALKAAMEKVKNPTAKAMLQKNIDKTYKKMAEKLGEIDGVKPEEEEKDEVATEDETIVTEPSVPVTEEEQQKEDEEVKPAVIIPAAPTKQADKEAKKAAIEVRKQEQQKTVEEKKAQKQAVKQVRKAEKQEVKQAKQAQPAAKKENKSNGNSGQNGNKGGKNPHNKQ